MKGLKTTPVSHILLGEQDKQSVECPRCGFEMKSMTACHMICTNCGGHMDCSEKGLTWG